MHFIYLSPYSPDLDPIEYGWKDLKRELSSILNFDERKQGYSRYWVEDPKIQQNCNR
ncbi:MAG: transposase [Methanosarcinales archaeon]